VRGIGKNGMIKIFITLVVKYGIVKLIHRLSFFQHIPMIYLALEWGRIIGGHQNFLSTGCQVVF
jgi:hypothetical protein